VFGGALRRKLYSIKRGCGQLGSYRRLRSRVIEDTQVFYSN
jgi:hypothetical protein